jgi:hypothetical protein
MIACGATVVAAAEGQVRRLPVKEYRDKMKAGWIGQILGVSWGAPTEGRYRQIMPEKEVPPFRETLINDAFGQDDLYVEMTFLRSMEQYGYDVSIRQAGIDFANSGYPLWVANDAGRRNLQSGIAPPDSSHPKFHNCAGAIDYQIESDFSGLIAPGMPNVAIALGEKFGRLMNYSDGMYAGQFMGGMYSEAFFESDVVKVIEAGLKCIPRECLYAEMVRDMLRWHREQPTDWQKTWHQVDKKYRSREYYISSLDVKLEGAFVLMGLLYGNRDPEQTIVISFRCGSDSDCNPSSSGGVLFTSLGLAKLPERYYRKLDQNAKFIYTAYNFPALAEVCEKLARQALVRSGGHVEKDAGGDEVFVIPVATPRPSKLEDLRKPGPIAGSLFTDAEMHKIHAPGLKWALPRVLPGWELADADQGRSAMHWEHAGKRQVIELAAAPKSKGWKLRRTVEIPAGKKATLTLAAQCAPKGPGWDLTLQVDKMRETKSLALPTSPEAWQKIEFVLPTASGNKAILELTGRPTGDAKPETSACYLADVRLTFE